MSDLPAQEIKISVKVIPGAHRNEILGISNDQWRIKIAAPPDKGKANRELIEFLSKMLKIKKVQINILKGQASHNKILGITGLSKEEISDQFRARL